jgi:uncharacterized membrane protein YphA (DoxX/SURF4 family)
MKTMNRIVQWNNIQDYNWSDFFRVFLGSFLFYIGMNYETNHDDINSLFYGSGLSSYLSLVQYIPFVNIIGGIMIAFGFKTRWAVAFQLPILAGAIVLYLITGGYDPVYYAKLTVSILTFSMLMGYMIKGSGPYSVDEFIKRNVKVADKEHSKLSHT